MNRVFSLIDPLVPRATQRAALLAQSRESDALFESRLIQLQASHAEQREHLLQAITHLDEELARGMALIQQEILDADLVMQMQLDEMDKQDEKERRASAFAKLPPEMLGYIFEQCVEGDQGEKGGEGLGISPWILASVCKLWYGVAMGMGSLWRKILVTDSLSYYWALERNSKLGPRHAVERTHTTEHTHSAMQVCVNKGQIEKAFRRAGVALLDITLGFKGGPQMNANRGFYEQLYSIVFNPSLGPRISHLTVECSAHCASYSTLHSVFTYISSYWFRSVLPNLVSLQIHSITPLSMLGPNAEPSLSLILEGAKRLRDIGLPRLYDPYRIPDGLQYNTWKPSNYQSTIFNLRELRVYQAHQLDQMLFGPVGIESLIIVSAALIEETPADRICELRTDPWPTIETPEITFERLTRLHLILGDISLLSRLTLPLLEELRLTPPSRVYDTRGQANELTSTLAHPNFTLELPSLHTLRVVSLNLSSLTSIDMSRLEHLYLTSIRTSQTKTDADFAALVSGTEGASALLRSVRTIYINALLSEKSILSVLKACPVVQTVLLVPGKVGNGLIPALNVGKIKHRLHSTVPILCPELEVLELDCHSFRRWDKATKRDIRVGTVVSSDLGRALDKMVKSRFGRWVERCTLVHLDGRREEFGYTGPRPIITL